MESFSVLDPLGFSSVRITMLDSDYEPITFLLPAKVLLSRLVLHEGTGGYFFGHSCSSILSP